MNLTKQEEEKIKQALINEENFLLRRKTMFWRGVNLALMITDVVMFVLMAVFFYGKDNAVEAARIGIVTIGVNIVALIFFICIPFWDE